MKGLTLPAWPSSCVLGSAACCTGGAFSGCASLPRGGGTTLGLSLLYRLSPSSTGWQKNSFLSTCQAETSDSAHQSLCALLNTPPPHPSANLYCCQPPLTVTYLSGRTCRRAHIVLQACPPLLCKHVVCMLSGWHLCWLTFWLASCSFSSLSSLPSAPKLRTRPTLSSMQLAITSFPDCNWIPSARNRLTLWGEHKHTLSVYTPKQSATSTVVPVTEFHMPAAPAK
jgi:hypothetical protein